MSARDVVLGRIRAALGPDPDVPDVPHDYRGAGSSEPEGEAAIVDRFAERVADYQATVCRCDEEGLGAVLAGLAGGGTVVASPALAALLRAHGSNDPDTAGEGPTPARTGRVIVDEPPLSAADLDACDTVLTGCALAIAETGTIALDGGPESGRRVISLIPDHHICVVRADQVVAAVPDAVAALDPAARRGLPLTLVSGPSATSDIELERVEGVHGPRRLDVVLVERAVSL